MVIAELVLIILVLEVTLIEVVEMLVLQRLAGEPVHRAGNKLLLDVFAKLVVKLETLLNVRAVIVLLDWRLWWVEEVEEGFSRASLADKTGTISVYNWL